LEEKCVNCHGSRRIRKDKEIEVDIPAGIDDGMMIKIT
jgi:molecular chaperone DnaJ